MTTRMMLTWIWINALWLKARIKESVGLRLTPTENFMIEIGLY